MHPTRTIVGGFTMLPEKRELEAFRKRLDLALDDLTQTAELFQTLALPDFTRETEFVSLKAKVPILSSEETSSRPMASGNQSRSIVQ